MLFIILKHHLQLYFYLFIYFIYWVHLVLWLLDIVYVVYVSIKFKFRVNTPMKPSAAKFLPSLDFPANVSQGRESAAVSLRPVTEAKQRAFVPLHQCSQRLKPGEMLERRGEKVPFLRVKLWGKWRVCGNWSGWMRRRVTWMQYVFIVRWGNSVFSGERHNASLHCLEKEASTL